MKYLLLAVLFFAPGALRAQSASAPAFPLTVHVASSVIEPIPGSTSDSVKGVDLMDLMQVTLQGKKLILAAPVHGGLFTSAHPVLITPGDYPVRLSENKQPNPGELQQTYQLRLANGKTVDLFL